MSWANHNDLPEGPPAGRSPRRRGRRASTLALRLTMTFGVGSAAVVALVAVALYLILAGVLRQEHNQFLRHKIVDLRQILADHPDDPGALREEVEEDWVTNQYVPICARVLDGAGRVVAEHPAMRDHLPAGLFPAPPDDAAADDAGGVSVSSDAGHPYRLAAARAAVGRDGRQQWVVQVALDEAPEQKLLARYRRYLALVGCGGMVVCAAIGYWAARRGLRPLRQITATAQRVQPNMLDERIDETRLPAELADLAGRFNRMLDRLRDSIQRLSLFSADLAHELRTPLNNLHGALEVALHRDRSPAAYRETISSALEECVRLTRVIESLLFIARADDARTRVRRERIDLAEELGRLCDWYAPLAAEARVALSPACAAGTTASLDRTLLRRAVDNLVANALAHTPPGGSVAVEAVRVPNGGGLEVRVRDTGSGIEPADLARVFDRFYRADRSRTATRGNVGLGLAIVKSIMSLHGGEVTIESRPGHGTQVTLRFPDDDDGHRDAADATLQAAER